MSNDSPLGRSRPVVCFVCTGNAARSVMAVTMLRALAGDLAVGGAGTHVLEGRPMGVRTRTALARYGLVDPHHRSRQFSAAEAGSSALVVAMEPAHILWIRARFPAAAAVTGSLRRLARDLARPGPGHPRPLAGRVAALDLAGIDPEPWEEVVDPGAGDQVDFDNCAAELHRLVGQLRDRLV